jgi:hypothetical protein
MSSTAPTDVCASAMRVVIPSPSWHSSTNPSQETGSFLTSLDAKPPSHLSPGCRQREERRQVPGHRQVSVAQLLLHHFLHSRGKESLLPL